MSGVAVLGMEVVGEPITGEWCDRCLLPSGIELLIALRWASGRHAGQHAGTLLVRRCADCEEPL